MIERLVAQPIVWETFLDAIVRILGFSLLAAGAAASAAFVFRWYSADEIPEGVPILLGVATVAVWLNTKTALQDAIIGETPLLDPHTAIYTIAALAASSIAADGGRRVGDYLAQDVFMVTTPRTMTEIRQLVRSAGRVVTVELPETIEDVDGYDPIDASTKAELAGKTFLLPRRLTAEQLRERLTDRLERDHGIGHVDVELTADGTIDYLALGSRPAGIGSTLATGSVAVAFRGDPAPDATPGDAVRIWRRDGRDGGSLRRVTGGELRGVAGDVATVAIDADDARAFEDETAYRIVTLPRNPGAERDLVSLLRAADETVTTLTVDDGDALEGATIESLPVLVLALERGASDTDPIALPGDETRLEAGDVAYVLGRPDALRRVAELNRDRDQEPESNAASDPERTSVTESRSKRTRER